MIKNGEVPKISDISKDRFHELTVNILKRVNFGDASDITDLADKYSDAYIKVYNFLAEKYYEDISENNQSAAKLLRDSKVYE